MWQICRVNLYLNIIWLLFEKIYIRKDRTWNPQVGVVASLKRAKTPITEKLYL